MRYPWLKICNTHTYSPNRERRCLTSTILDTVFFDDPSIGITNRTLKWFYRLFSPGFCLGNGLLELTFGSFGVTLGGNSGVTLMAGPSDPLGWESSGRDVFFLFVSAPVLLGPGRLGAVKRS